MFEWIERARWTGTPGYRLGICLPEGALIGTVGFGGDPLELGYSLAEDQVGKGYATEAAHVVLADDFARFGMEAVVAEHFDDNPSSGYLLRKLGFVGCSARGKGGFGWCGLIGPICKMCPICQIWMSKPCHLTLRWGGL